MRCINLLYLIIVSIAVNANYSSGKVVTGDIMKIYLEQIDKIMDKTYALRNHYWKKKLSTHPSSTLLQTLYFKELELSPKDATKLSNYLSTLKDFLSAFVSISIQSASNDSNITKLAIEVKNVIESLNKIIHQNQIVVDKSLKPKFDKTKVLKTTEEHLKRINSSTERPSLQRNLLIHAFTNQFSIFLYKFKKYMKKSFGKYM